MKFYMRPLFFLLLCFGLSGLSACGNTQELTELNDPIDLLELFHKQLEQETTAIDLRRDAGPEEYLLQGWASPEKNFTWGLKDRSKLLFYREDTRKDLQLEILCEAYPALDERPQATEVFVNGIKAASFTPEVGELKLYTLPVPAETLRSGPNVLEFRFAYYTKPSERDPESPDSRRLAVAFQSIRFSESGNMTYLREATQQIDFRQGSDSRDLLLSGWRKAEPDRTWSWSKVPRVRFYAYKKKALKLELVCDTLPSLNGEEQIVNVLLNNKPAGSFTVEAKHLRPYTVKLPAEALRFGLNMLEFQASYSSQPARVVENSGDTRDLALAFQQIAFTNNPPLEPEEHRKIMQEADSDMALVHRISETFDFELTYKSSRGARPKLLLSRDTHDAIVIELPPGKKTHRETVALPEPGVYSIRLLTEGKAGSVTEWKDFQLSSTSLPASSRKQPADSQTAGFTKASKPDIVLYIVDTLRADHLGCYGYARDTSPQLDRFAAESTIFTNAYSPVAWTKPSAATIISGLLPKNHKTYTRKAKLPAELVTLAEALRANGYHTVGLSTNAYFGKSFDLAQGFDDFRSFFQPTPVTVSVMSHTINEELLPFLKQYAAVEDRKPLFLMVWTVDPHDPYTPHESVKDMFGIDQYEPIDTYDAKFLFRVQSTELQPTPSQKEFVKTRYDQEIFWNDLSFGALLDTMKSVGMYEDAVILFSSDHGEEFWDHGGTGHGRTLYNELVKIPFVLKAKQLSTGVNSRLTQHVDIYPTILDLVGVDLPYQVDGVSIVAASQPERRLFFEGLFDSSVLTASLDDRMKTIFNRKVHRPGVPGHVPTFEVFPADDLKETQNLGLNSIEAALRFDELFAFIRRASSLSWQEEEVEIPEELDEHLKELGYVQ